VADIFQEVDEEVRRDRAMEVWKKYGNYIIAAAVLIVAATAAWVGWKEYTRSQRQAEGARFEQALELVRDGKNGEAANAFNEIAEDAGSGYGALARLRAAAALAAEGDSAAAAQEYARLAAEGDDELLSGAAVILEALTTFETAPPDVLRGSLSPLAEGFGPWSHMARELLAVLMIQQGDKDGARKALAALSDDATAPEGVRARAAEMLAALDGGN
jgi:hypothetical protein